MYLGRIVAAGMTKDGNPTAAYRVSSRSFPNRTAHLANETISINEIVRNTAGIPFSDITIIEVK